MATSPEFPRKFEEFLEDISTRSIFGVTRPSIKRELRRANAALRRNGFKSNLDFLYSFFLGASTPKETLFQAGPFPAFMSRKQPIRTIKPLPRAEVLRRLVEEFILREYYVANPFFKDQTVLVYDRLFARLCGRRLWKESKVDWKRHTLHVFTTNYDNSLDTYAQKTIPAHYTKGYTPITGNRVEFRPELFEKSKYKLKVYQLNGSIELSRLDDGTMIAETPPGQVGDKRDGRTIASKVMVYGTANNLYQEPFFELLKRLNRLLEESGECTMVGYSFGDSWIRQIFENVALKRGPAGFKIRLISRNPRRTMRRLGPLARFVRPKKGSLKEYLDLD